MSNGASKFHAIQLLRGIAALMVVFHHARNPVSGIYDPIPQLLSMQSGVDIFFVISGFIMFTAAKNENWKEFIIKRAIRIAPLYWIANAAKFVTMGIKIINSNYLIYVFLSVLFIPVYSNQHPEYIWPFLTPGWSLNFEILFYSVFALGLYFGKLEFTVFMIMAILITSGQFYHGHNAAIITYTSPIIIEFCLGACIAQYRHNINGPIWYVMAPIGFGAILYANGIFTIDSGNFTGFSRLLYFGIPATLIVGSFVSYEKFAQNFSGAKYVEYIGNASYAIYLFQEYSINIAEKMIRHFPLTGNVQFIATMLLTMGTATGIGLAAHAYLEKPVLRLARKALLAPKHAA